MQDRREVTIINPTISIGEENKVTKIAAYRRYLDGNSLEQLQDYLKNNNIKTHRGKDVWCKEVIRSLLTNEKYVGDLMLQKTFSVDCISKKTKKNRGELAKYLISNNHPAIIDRDTYNAVQLEMARRSSKSKKSRKTITEQGKYSGKYVLSEILICENCGSHYRRTYKNKNGKKRYVWRCINRIENGEQICDAPGLNEDKLHEAICRCLNELFTDKADAMELLKSNLSYVIAGDNNSLNAYAIENEIKMLMEKADENVEMAYKTTGDKERFLSATKMIYKKIAVLREQLDLAKQQMEEKCNLKNKVDELFSVFQNENLVFDEFDEITVRRLVECIRVSKDRTITLILKGGMQTSKNIF